MADAAGIPDLEALLRNDVWLRRLAKRLAFGINDAEDLVQETLLVAIKSHPRNPARLNAWLRRVLRNFGLQLGRRERERPLRESTIAAEEATPSQDKLVQQVRLQRMLVDAVLGLQESWQTAVLLHFYADVPSVEIGRRLGVPDSTVRSWIHRALAELRRKIERETGSRGENLSSTLLPLMLTRGHEAGSTIASAAARTVARDASLTTGAMIMAAKTKAAIVIVLVGLAGGAWWMVHQAKEKESFPSVSPPRLVGAGAPPADESPPSSIATTPFADPGAVDTAEDPGTASNKDASVARIQGIVLSANGMPVPGADVFARPARIGNLGSCDWREFIAGIRLHTKACSEKGIPLPDFQFRITRTDEEGRFDLEVLRSPMAVILAFAPEHGLAYRHGFPVTRDGVNAVELRFAPGVTFLGRVTDERGEPVAGAEVSTMDMSAERESIGGLTSVLHTATIKTDSDGAWNTWPMPGPVFTVRAELAGYQRTHRWIRLENEPGLKQKRVDLVLTKSDSIVGSFVLADGTPARLESRIAEIYGPDAARQAATSGEMLLVATALDPETEQDPGLVLQAEQRGEVTLAEDTWRILPDSPPKFAALAYRGEVIGSVKLDPEAPANDMVIHPERLPPARRTGTLIIRARDAVTQAELESWHADAHLSASDPGGRYLLQGRQSLTRDGPGVARFEEVVEGIWGIEITAAGYCGWSGDVVVLPGAEAKADVALRAPTASIVGTVVDSTGNPVSGANLRLYMSNGHIPGPSGLFHAGTNAEGRFAFPSVAPGPYVVIAFAGALKFCRVGVRVQADALGTETRIVLQDGVKVKPGLDRPYNWLDLELRNSEGVTLYGLHGPIGGHSGIPNFRLLRGHYTIEASAPGFRPSQVEFEAVEGAIIKIPMEPESK